MKVGTQNVNRRFSHLAKLNFLCQRSYHFSPILYFGAISMVGHTPTSLRTPSHPYLSYFPHAFFNWPHVTQTVGISWMMAHVNKEKKKKRKIENLRCVSALFLNIMQKADLLSDLLIKIGG